MSEESKPEAGLGNLRVLALESRRAREMAQLITNRGGQAMVAPTTREVPAGGHGDAPRFVLALEEGRVDVVIFLTGVGARALAKAAEALSRRNEFITALRRITVIARGPKPVAALREWGVPIAAVVPEPNTWRELLQMLDENKAALPVEGRTVAVQEHGAASPELVAGLSERGAQVLPVHIYEWRLPEDTKPLRQAAEAIVRGEIDVLLVTSAVQIRHLLLVAEEMKLRDDVVRALSRVVVGSIGPVTSAGLREAGIHVDMEPSHPKMGFLVKEVAERASALRKTKQTVDAPHA
jgi:uroporphyrinogen-III synthase